MSSLPIRSRGGIEPGAYSRKVTVGRDRGDRERQDRLAQLACFSPTEWATTIRPKLAAQAATLVNDHAIAIRRIARASRKHRLLAGVEIDRPMVR